MYRRIERSEYLTFVIDLMGKMKLKNFLVTTTKIVMISCFLLGKKIPKKLKRITQRLQHEGDKIGVVNVLSNIDNFFFKQKYYILETFGSTNPN